MSLADCRRQGRKSLRHFCLVFDMNALWLAALRFSMPTFQLRNSLQSSRCRFGMLRSIATMFLSMAACGRVMYSRRVQRSNLPPMARQRKRLQVRTLVHHVRADPTNEQSCPLNAESQSLPRQTARHATANFLNAAQCHSIARPKGRAWKSRAWPLCSPSAALKGSQPATSSPSARFPSKKPARARCSVSPFAIFRKY